MQNGLGVAIGINGVDNLTSLNLYLVCQCKTEKIIHRNTNKIYLARDDLLCQIKFISLKIKCIKQF